MRAATAAPWVPSLAVAVTAAVTAVVTVESRLSLSLLQVRPSFQGSESQAHQPLAVEGGGVLPGWRVPALVL